ncbi:MAG: dsbD [Deltaproteobacteria bacterium]|nr:dsbD [Deltaproteobacteria bacterium]
MNPAISATINVNGIAAFISGLLSFFTPCILPLVPSYIIYISGITVHDMSVPGTGHRKKVFFHSLCFILGFSFVFVALGISSSLIGNFLSHYQAYIIRIGGVILIVLGLFYLDILKIPFFNRQFMLQLDQKPIGLFGSFIVGITFSLGWTPCVGPALSSILLVASMSGRASHGVYLLSLYSLGLAIPFVISSLLFDKLFILLKKYSFVSRYAVRLLGILLIILGVVMVSSYYTILNVWLGMIFS